MTRIVVGFDWDAGNRDKCQKHGVSQAEVKAIFHMPDVFIADDREYSQKKPRFLASGKTNEDRALSVAFTLRDKGGLLCIRPISARSMHQKERQQDEQETAKF